MAYKWNTGIPEPSYAKTDKEARNLLNYLMQYEGPVGFDTETWGKKLPFKIGTESPLDWMNDTVTFWSLSFQDQSGQFQRWCLQQQHLTLFIPFLENPKSYLVTWNGKYDAHVAWNSGVNVWSTKYIDVMAMALLHNENIQGSAGLKDCAKRWLEISMTKFKDLFSEVEGKVKEYETSLFDLPIDTVIRYASLDAYATLQLYYILKAKLEEDPLNPNSEHSPTMWDYFLDIEVPTTRMLWRMERRGMVVDREYLSSKIPLIDVEIENIKKEVNKICGTVVNISSPRQLAKIFFGPEKDGGMGLIPIKKSDKTSQPSCDEEVMGNLEEQGIPLATKIVRARKLMKTRSTYLAALLQLAGHYEDHRIHPSFKQMGARTGRFSSTQPNSQNFPRPDGDEWGIRKAFIPEPNHKLIVADYEQLEMRIMAHMSQDPRMIQAIRNNLDLHCFTASHMYNIPYDAIIAAKKAENPTPEQKKLKQFRQDAKTIGFGIIYGAGPVKIGKELGIPKEEAKKKINAYLKKTFPGVDSYMQKTIGACVRDGFVRTISGRRRRLEDTIRNLNFTIRGHAEREAINATIQGSAADIVKNAMLQIEEHPELQRMGAYILNQIHDELVIEVPTQHAEAASAIIKDVMEHPFEPGVEALCVSLPVDLHIVDNWAEAKA